jgi:hypothetical protein
LALIATGLPAKPGPEAVQVMVAPDLTTACGDQAPKTEVVVMVMFCPNAKKTEEIRRKVSSFFIILLN